MNGVLKTFFLFGKLSKKHINSLLCIFRLVVYGANFEPDPGFKKLAADIGVRKNT